MENKRVDEAYLKLLQDLSGRLLEDMYEDIPPISHYYIMAPTWFLFRHYCAKHNLSPHQCHYIDRYDKIASLERGTVYNLIGDQYGAFLVPHSFRREYMRIIETIDARPELIRVAVVMEEPPT